jgi:hypothetical protein
MCFALRKFAYSVRRRCLAPVLALAYVMAMVGAPWPTPTASRDTTPFPCQGHRCGCLSAEQCWGHCCCFTPEQQLAWAAANQVEPPAELAAAVSGDAVSGDAVSDDAVSDDAVSDRDEDEHLAADEHQHLDDHPPAAHSCCHKHADVCALSAAPALKQGKKAEGQGFQTFKCRGISTLWVTTGAVAPTVAPVAWTIDWSIVGTVPALRCSLSAVTFLPAVPPPRLAASRLASAGV